MQKFNTGEHAAPVPQYLASQMTKIGALLVRLRYAHPMRQEDAAALTGISRNTAYRIENGDSSVAIGNILRYLEVLSPGATIGDLFDEGSATLVTLRLREARRRTRVVLKKAIRIEKSE